MNPKVEVNISCGFDEITDAFDVTMTAPVMDFCVDISVPRVNFPNFIIDVAKDESIPKYCRDAMILLMTQKFQQLIGTMN